MKEKSDIKRACYYIERAHESFSLAFNSGSKVKSIEWINDIEKRSISSSQDFYKFAVENLDFDTKVFQLNKLKNFSFNQVNAYLNFYLCETFYHRSLELMEDKLNLSSQMIKECSYFYEESLKCLNKNNKSHKISEFNLDLEELYNDFMLQDKILDGLRQKRLADLLYDKAINQAENLDLELIWDSIDLYREAIRKTANKDLEIEAEILCKIGTIYEFVLRLMEKSKECYMACFNLAESLKPKMFTNKSWYIKCRSAIERFQKKVLKEEEIAREEEKKKVLHKIKDDLHKIKVKEDSLNCSDFIKFVYTDYPPQEKRKNYENIQKNLKDLNVKKAYQLALCDYHPDKNINDERKEMKFIYEEISKYLGHRYQNIKEADSSV